MPERPEPRRHPRRQRRRIAGRLRQLGGLRPARATVGIAALLAALGFAISAQSLNENTDPLRDLTEAELVALLQNVEDREDAIDEQRLELESQQRALEAGEQDRSEAVTAAQERLDELGILAGTEPAVGPGITMRLTDPQGNLMAADLLDAVQELRDAGAEAMQINGHRVVADTYFVDTQDGIALSDQPLESPYEVRAIGDGPTMSTAMEIPGGVTESAEQEGAHVSIEIPDQVTVEATVPLKDPEAASPVEGEDG